MIITKFKIKANKVIFNSVGILITIFSYDRLTTSHMFILQWNLGFKRKTIKDIGLVEVNLGNNNIKYIS